MRSWLTESSETKELLEVFDSGEFEPKHRQLLVRIAVSKLYGMRKNWSDFALHIFYNNFAYPISEMSKLIEQEIHNN